MTPAQPVPQRKLVVSPPHSGTYAAMYGPVLNPVNGDYSTGSIDPENARLIYCNPEPRHCRWKYWEPRVTKRDGEVTRLHCLQVFGEWWVVDVDVGAGMFQQVAALDVADNPDHNSGIHQTDGVIVLRGEPDPSDPVLCEFYRVVRENMPQR